MGLVNRRRGVSVDAHALCWEWHRGIASAIIETAMAITDLVLRAFPWNERYRVPEIEDVLTPALVVYPEVVSSNISRTLQLLGGNAERWRVHIKTAKLAYTLRLLTECGVRNFKCATTLELLTACRAGAKDVLVAYPVMGANARRVREIADEFPQTAVSVLVEDPAQLEPWREGRVGIFLDVNPGMNRTGIEIGHDDKIARLIRAVRDAGLEFRGLHCYDGQYGSVESQERLAAAHAGYDQLLKLVDVMEQAGLKVPEVITAGTPTFPASIGYKGFQTGSFIHRVSPGTIVYGDATSLAQLPPDLGYQPAVLVLSRVVSHPHPGIVTCDAGHKAVSADAGVPTCVVVGHPDLTPLSPSEEHLPIRVGKPPGPSLGDALYLLPRHVCPTVNNFDSVLIIRGGQIEGVEQVSARGRERPLASGSSVSRRYEPAVKNA